MIPSFVFTFCRILFSKMLNIKNNHNILLSLSKIINLFAPLKVTVISNKWNILICSKVPRFSLGKLSSYKTDPTVSINSKNSEYYEKNKLKWCPGLDIIFIFARGLRNISGFTCFVSLISFFCNWINSIQPL